ncbi:MAG: imidazole glycerol phosphate synthase subunit HisH [Brevundimonas sp.]|uniref:imidazole glycerol phosphate synthase subunit HisH n=1 Tax=Brevundimonas sp. TaxID=1871086 RepID=UPI003918F6A4
MSEVVLIDMGCGNTASVMFALERLGARAFISSDAGEIASAPRAILPGVGAAGPAMARLRERGLDLVVRDYPRPLLGICLGMQVLFEHSEEQDTPCLGLISGRVGAIAPGAHGPSPHMGWNALVHRKDDPLLIGIDEGAYAYFVHGFGAAQSPASLALADYGGRWSAVVRQGLVWGCQFHPERSGEVGARILENFLNLQEGERASC